MTPPAGVNSFRCSVCMPPQNVAPAPRPVQVRCSACQAVLDQPPGVDQFRCPCGNVMLAYKG